MCYLFYISPQNGEIREASENSENREARETSELNGNSEDTCSDSFNETKLQYVKESFVLCLFAKKISDKKLILNIFLCVFPRVVATYSCVLSVK